MAIPHGNSLEYLFVDGGSLRGYLETVSREFFGGQQFELDLKSLSSQYTKLFFYDAIPVREPEESEQIYNERCAPQQALFARLRATDDVHVYEGDARRRKKRGLEQKMVDVMLAVDMLTHTFRKNMNRATLFTGDQDFKPLIDALISEGMYVTLWFPPGETNGELRSAADRRRPLGLQELKGMLTPESQARFNLADVANIDPSVELGPSLLEWYDEQSRMCSFGQVEGGWFVARLSDKLNRLTIWHANLRMTLLIAEDNHFYIPSDVQQKIANLATAALTPPADPKTA